MQESGGCVQVCPWVCAALSVVRSQERHEGRPASGKDMGVM